MPPAEPGPAGHHEGERSGCQSRRSIPGPWPWRPVRNRTPGLDPRLDRHDALGAGPSRIAHRDGVGRGLAAPWSRARRPALPGSGRRDSYDHDDRNQPSVEVTRTHGTSHSTQATPVRSPSAIAPQRVSLSRSVGITAVEAGLQVGREGASCIAGWCWASSGSQCWAVALRSKSRRFGRRRRRSREESRPKPPSLHRPPRRPRRLHRHRPRARPPRRLPPRARRDHVSCRPRQPRLRRTHRVSTAPSMRSTPSRQPG